MKVFLYILVSLNWVGLKMNSIFWWKTVVAITGANSIWFRAELSIDCRAGTEWGAGKKWTQNHGSPEVTETPLPLPRAPYLLMLAAVCLYVLVNSVAKLEPGLCILKKIDLTDTWPQFQSLDQNFIAQLDSEYS